MPLAPLPWPLLQECLLYSTIHGAIGALLPFASKDDVDFFTHLELFMRAEGLSPVGREHVSFRSSFVPVKVGPLPQSRLQRGAPLLCAAASCHAGCYRR